MTTPRFDELIDWTLDHEGGFSDHPNDEGGATNFGVSLRSLRDLERDNIGEWDEDGDGDVDADDMRLLTVEKAKAFYYEHFWLDAFDMFDAPRVAGKVFDIGVNTGKRQAGRIFQRTLNRFGVVPAQKITVDGIVGPATAGKLNELVREGKFEHILADLCAEQAAFYWSLVQASRSREVFLMGWLNRAYATPA